MPHKVDAINLHLKTKEGFQMNTKTSHSSRVRGTTLKTLAAAVAATLSLGANAETPYFDEALVFGDSLLDGGSFGLRFTNQLPSGEFAPVSSQLWARSLGLDAEPAIGGGTNYAIGGLTTQEILTTIIGDDAGEAPLGVDPYLAIAAPTARSLAFVDGGGNDFLQGLITDQASTSAAVTTLLGSVGALDSTGINYIFLSNLPNLGQTAAAQAADAAAGNQNFSATSSAGSAGFNQLLAMGAGSVGANIIPVDTAGMFAYVLSNIDSFSFVSGDIGAPIEQQFMCFDGSGDDCIEHPDYGISQETADPDKLIFNDGVHPTASVHSLWADYLSDIVNAPRVVGTLPQLGLNVARQQLQVAGDQFSEQRGKASEASWFISGALGSADIDAAGMPEDQHNSLSIGGFVPLSEQLTLGGIISLGDQETDLSGGSIDSSSVGFSATLTYRSDALFVESIGSLALSNHDEVQRSFNLGPQQLRASGETDGETLAFDLLAGFDLMADSETLLAPAIGVRMLNSSVDGYLESGGAVSNYQWADQEMDSKQLRLGVIGKMLVSDNVSLQAEIFANDESEDGFTQVNVKNTTAGFPGYHLPGIYIDGGSFITADVGLSMSAGAGRVRVGYSYSDQGEGSNALRVNYSAKF